MTTRSSRFYPGSLALFVAILEGIEKGLIQEDVAKELGLKSSHVSYYIKKAKKLEYVRESAKDAISVLELTRFGKNFLAVYEKGVSIPICRAENVRFKAEVLKMPLVPVDWKKVEVQNWFQYNTEVDSIKIKLNMGNTPTIEFIPAPIEGDDPYKLYNILLYNCIEVLPKIEQRLDMKIGRLELSSRAEWLVYDPVARAFCKTVGQVNYKGFAKVNASKPRSIGEFEFHDPRSLYNYLEMPERVAKIERVLDKLVKFQQIREPN
jgi:hypothetical protein